MNSSLDIFDLDYRSPTSPSAQNVGHSVVPTVLINGVLLDSRSVTSERPGLMLTMIRWWEALRAPEVPKWQQKYRVECDATDGRVGGAERIVRETLLEMEGFNFQAGEKDQGAVVLVLDLAKSLGSDAFQFLQEDFAGGMWGLRAPAASSVRRTCGGAAPDHHGHSPWVEVELLGLAHCVSGRATSIRL